MAAASSLQLTLLRLIEIVEEETAVLRQATAINHARYTERKNQALRELMAAQRRDATASMPPPCAHLLQRLSAAMQDNARLLKLHIAAVGEVSDIIVAGLREAESDGTYSRAKPGR